MMRDIIIPRKRTNNDFQTPHSFTIIVAFMKKRFLDKNVHVETKKAQRYYALSSFYETMVFSFLTLFLNECKASLRWENWMQSLSLFLPPIIASFSIFVSSFFVTHHKNNLKAMRALTLLSFLALISFSFLGLFLPNGMNSNGEVVDYRLYYSLFAVMMIFPPLLMGLHWSFLSFQISNIADINYVEKTRFGHVCIFGPIVSMLISPFAGYIAESLFTSYQGYLFLFFVASPLLLFEFAFTFSFKSYDPSLFHNDEEEKTTYKELFSNQAYRRYLLIAMIWIPSIWAGASLVSSYWNSLEGVSSMNAFNPLMYGVFLAFSSLVEAIFVYLNTKVGFGKRVVFSMNLALFLLFLGALGFAILSYFFRVPPESGYSLAILIIFLHSFKGISNGLYCTSNLAMLHHILGPKYRRKAVFIAPAIYQFINAFLQLAYPFLNHMRYVSFFVLAGIVFLGFVLSLFQDGPLLHWKFNQKDELS